jgi:hypothetical protein
MIKRQRGAWCYGVIGVSGMDYVTRSPPFLSSFKTGHSFEWQWVGLLWNSCCRAIEMAISRFWVWRLIDFCILHGLWTCVLLYIYRDDMRDS